MNYKTNLMYYISEFITNFIENKQISSLIKFEKDE